MSFLWHGLTEQGAQVPVQVDAQGRVVAVDGTPGVSNWDRTGTTLSPATAGDSVDIGSGKIKLNSNGSAELAGYIESSDIINGPGIRLTGTAGLVQVRNDNNNSISLAIYKGGVQPADIVMSVNDDGTTKIGGTLPSAPNISLNANGSASFSKPAQNSAGSGVYIGPNDEAGNISVYSDDASASNGDRDTAFLLGFSGGSSKTLKFQVGHDGSATFAGNITAPNVTFRSADPQFYVKKSKSKSKDAQAEYVGPELDLLAEIARLEALVRHLYETLRITPPAGWPVWDGNDDVLRQLRK